MSEAANLAFQEKISVKHNFFHVSIVKETNHLHYCLTKIKIFESKSRGKIRETIECDGGKRSRIFTFCQ